MYAKRKFPFLLMIVFSLVTTLPMSALWANVIGADTQNFNPTTSGLDFVTVESSETLKPSYMNFGLFLNYAVNSLPVFNRDDGDLQSRKKFHDRLISSDLNIGIGILKNWDFGLNIPYLLYQSVNNEGFRGQFAETGLIEIRANTKVRVVGDDSQGIAFGITANINQLKNNPFTGKNPGPTYTFQLIGDKQFGDWALGINLGYRKRSPGERLTFDDGSEYPIEPLKDQQIWSVATNYLFDSIDTKLILEVFGSEPVDKSDSDFSNRLQSSREILLGIKTNVLHNVDWHMGAGTELAHGISSPDWRIYTGVNWVIGEEKKEKPQIEKRVPQKEERIVIHDILFEFNSDSMVLQGSAEILAKLSRYLKKQPVFKKVIIEGHTDSIGSKQYNANLSRRRAETIKKWLVKTHQLPSGKLFTEGKGETEPIANNGNYQGRQLNRRVVFHIFR